MARSATSRRGRRPGEGRPSTAVWFDGRVLVRRARAVLLCAALVVGAVACGDDDSSSTTTTTTTSPPSTTNPGPIGSASAELCDARDELQSAISDLSKVDVVKNGTSAVTSALS